MSLGGDVTGVRPSFCRATIERRTFDVEYKGFYPNRIESRSKYYVNYFSVNKEEFDEDLSATTPCFEIEVPQVVVTWEGEGARKGLQRMNALLISPIEEDFPMEEEREEIGKVTERITAKVLMRYEEEGQGLSKIAASASLVLGFVSGKGPFYVAPESVGFF